MPPAHHFQPPSHSRPGRKRKRKQSDAAAGAAGTTEWDIEDEGDEAAAPSGIARLTANDAEQYRVSGLPVESEMPSYPFPHASLASRTRSGRQSKISTRKRATGPSATTSEPAAPNIRQKHLAVLNTVLHRCLLDGDYQRAARAWALLLRSGDRFDIRSNDQWGIGAEILMRTKCEKNGNEQTVNGNNSNDDDDIVEEANSDFDPSNTRAVNASPYTHNGFEAAKTYYERLIVQFPDLRGRIPTLPRAATFYPALFSVWIFQAAQARREALAKLKSDESMLTGLQPSDAVRDQQLRAIEAAEAGEARAIADRLDSLLTAPPYDKDEELLRLRDMVSSWLAELSTVK